ncbi:MAG: ribonuclease HII, partial [Archaeoglobaceae archaeon]
LSKKKREELAEKIVAVAKVEVLKISAEELNELMERRTLNEILKDGYEAIIKRLKPSIVFLDSPDVKPERLASYLKSVTGVEVIAEHGADERYPIVSSASIIAKVEREREIERLKMEVGDFGSGYASDPKTIEFLKKQKEFPSFVRKKWKTLDKLRQRRLEDFLI